MKPKIRLGIGFLCLILGACIFLIPIGLPLYNKAQQQKMMESFKEEIQKQAEKKVPDSECKETYTQEAAALENEFLDLELIEEEDSDSSQADVFLKDQNVIGLIEIDKLNIIFPIVEGTKRENIRAAIGRMSNTRDLGEKGNCVLAGHRGGIYGEFFKNIHKLEAGDEVKVIDAFGTEFVYTVWEQFLVEPADFSICDDIGEAKTLTLLSCEDNAAKRRIVRCIIE